MQAWHDAGYLHGDIKPANIAVDEDDRVRLLDTSHSLCIKDKRRRWPVRGTEGFEAPDAVASLSSELFSIGATLKHEVLTTATLDAHACGVRLTDSLIDRPTVYMRVPQIDCMQYAPDYYMRLCVAASYSDPAWVALEALCRDLMEDNATDRPTAEEALKRAKVAHDDQYDVCF